MARTRLNDYSKIQLLISEPNQHELKKAVVEMIGTSLVPAFPRILHKSLQRKRGDAL